MEAIVARIRLERCGDGLAVQLRAKVAAHAGLHESDSVDIEVRGGGIVIRRAASSEHAAALAAAEEIMAEGTRYRLDGYTIGELLAEGRRG
jgi:antitoxin component of MazEF toxin-antitoxin module